MDTDIGRSAEADGLPMNEAPSGSSPSVGIPSAEEVRLAAQMLEPKDFEPFVRKAADELYSRIMETCEDYLCENVDWNISSKLAMFERENQRMRTELFEVDRALGCLSMGHPARIVAIQEVQGRYNQASSDAWALREQLASAMSAREGQDPAEGLGATPASAVPKGDAQ